MLFLHLFYFRRRVYCLSTFLKCREIVISENAYFKHKTTKSDSVEFCSISRLWVHLRYACGFFEIVIFCDFVASQISHFVKTSCFSQNFSFARPYRNIEIFKITAHTFCVARKKFGPVWLFLQIWSFYTKIGYFAAKCDFLYIS